MVRGKFVVNKIAQVSWSKNAREISLNAACDDGIEENKRYAKATPSGSITIMIDNPPASDFFAMGKAVYVDFTDAEPVPGAETRVV